MTYGKILHADIYLRSTEYIMLQYNNNRLSNHKLKRALLHTCSTVIGYSRFERSKPFPVFNLNRFPILENQ